MGKRELEQRLTGTLKRLEQSAEQVVNTRGYTKDVAKIKMLSELIKEQLKNENSHNTAG